jgi:hypothetical protein
MVNTEIQSSKEPPWRIFHKEVFLFTTGALRSQRGFFAYREVPIGENSLFIFRNSIEIHFGSKHFCLSRQLAGQTKTFLCVLRVSVVRLGGRGLLRGAGPWRF